MVVCGAIATLAAVIVPAAPAAAASFTPPESDFVGINQVTLSGTKDASSSVRIATVDGFEVCTVADESTTWSCAGIVVPNGRVTFEGVESTASGDDLAFGPLALRVLGPPRVDGAGTSTITAGRFTGTAEAGARVEVQTSAETGERVQHPCPSALENGFWSCVVDVPSGIYQVRARQSSAAIGDEWSGYSAAATAVVDRDAPAPPSIDFPRTGTRTATGRIATAGTGETDATLQVFIDGGLGCETLVDANGVWRCDLQLPSAGVRSLQALQRDAAGNYSAPGPPVRVEFVRQSTEQPGLTPPPSSGGGATEPEGGATASPEPGSTASPEPGGGSSSPEPRGDRTTPAPLTSNWGTPTGFGSSLPTMRAIAERGGLVEAPLVALAYLMLVALPLRWFATHALPRLRLARPRFTGRNRGIMMTADDAPVLAPSIVAVGVFGGAALLAALSGGLGLEVRSLRLTAAIGLGLLLLNAIGVALPGRIAGGLGRVEVVARLLPGILVAATIAALVSRFGNLQPAVLIGVLIVANAAGAARFRARVGIAIAQLVGVAGLALAAWLAHGLLAPGTGFWGSFGIETAAAIALGGFGSLLLMLLPVGPFPGRAVYAVSRTIWAISALAAASVTGVIVASGANFPLALLGIVAGAVGAVLVGVTVWTRWVEPALR